MIGTGLVFLCIFSSFKEIDFPCSSVSIIMIIIGGILYLKYRRDRDKFNEENEPLWNNAVERWKNLYYCGRDHIIFDPNNGEYLPPRL
jgi:hypothetical protein